MRAIFYMLVLVGSLGSPAQAMQLLVAESSDWCLVEIRGRIDPGDDEVFRKRMVSALRTCSWVSDIGTFSPGGNVAAAMGIGEQIRLLEAKTHGPSPLNPWWSKKPGDGPRLCTFSLEKPRAIQVQYEPKTGRGDARCVCASACFLIRAAGTARTGHSIAMHRPFFDPAEFAGLSSEEARHRYEQVTKITREYLRRMDVPDPIITKMFSADSHRAIYMSAEEARLLFDLPYLEELIIARCGKEKDPRAMTRYMSMCALNVGAELGRAAAKRYLQKYGST